MKKFYNTLIVIAVLLVAFIIAGPFYVINEGEQAVVVRLGEIKEVVTEAGLKVKIPFVDEVFRYPKKIMAWSGEARIVPTAERQFIYVDVVARWRIADPQKFYEAINTVNIAYSKLAEIIDSEVRTVVAENPLIESVRNSDVIMDRSLSVDLSMGDDLDAEAINSATQSSTNHEPIKRGRRELAEEILMRSRRMVPEFGIELIDVVTRQISYSPELTPSVYARMIRERNQIAMYYRSEGEGHKAEWLGKMDREKDSILSAANAQAQATMGRADAEAARIYTAAYTGEDRANFYSFWRAIESYRQTIPKFNKTLTTDMEYFRYLYSIR